MAYITVKNLNKIYGKGDTAVHAVQNVSFEIRKGEFVAVIGESGSGKSTLLNMLGGLDIPTSGEVIINEKSIHSMKKKELTRFRRKEIGFIFQSFNLIPELDVEQNIIFPVLLDKGTVNKEYLEELLDTLGLTERRHHLPSELSGGQQQRVAIGRALINHPSLILADEPTGNLDKKNNDEVIKLLKETSEKYNQTIVMITHNERIAEIAKKVLTISDGRLIN